jgi:neutral amino acid transport system permease protein
MDLLDIFGDAARSAVGTNAAIYALLAIGLNLHFGYAGLTNVGQVGFMMLGAYGAAVAVGTWGWPLWIGLLVSILACVLFALALGLPTLRLRTDYFAITTIAAAEILRFLIRARASTDITGGPFGIQGVTTSFRDLNPYPDTWDLRWGSFGFTNEQLWVMTVAWSLVAACTMFVQLLIRSPWGRVLRGIREDEDAVRSLGKNVVSYKMQALILGGVIGGFAGIIDLFDQGSADPAGYKPQVTFFAYTALILGGAATRFGPIIGAMLFWFLRQGIESVFRDVAIRDWPPDWLSNFLDGREGLIATTLMGVVLVSLMIFRPQGLVGNREEMMLDAR